MITRRPWIIALSTISVLIVVNYLHEILFRIPGYRHLYQNHAFYIPESIDKIGGASLCVLVVWLMYGARLPSLSYELGLSAPVVPGLAFGLIVSSPMLIGFAINHRLTPHVELLPVFFRTIFSPLVEEIRFRGFGVRQLQLGTRWPFWIVVWPSAVLFGLVYRWQSFWVTVALHIFMNLWWELFSVASSAIGGWFDFVLLTVTMLVAIIVTLYWTRPGAMAVSTP